MRNSIPATRPTLRFIAALVPGLLLPLAACTGSADSGSPAGAGDDGSSPPVSASIDHANVPRDSPGSLDPGAIAGAAAANNAFAFDLYAHVLAAQSSPSNVLTSPISASLALTMTYAGAQGQTATEMAAALHFGAAASTIFDGQNGLSTALASRGASALAGVQRQASEQGQPAPSASDYEMQIVNSVWGEETYPWAQPFLTILAKSYGTGVYVEDFIHAWEPARLAINAWVSTETADKINDLLPGNSLGKTTRMVLVDAIRLKLPWASPFATTATAPSTFTRSDGTTVSAPFMNQTESLSYVDDGKAQIVALPLAGQQVSVILALPEGDLATYEAGLTTLAPPLTRTEVALSLPKLAFTSASTSLAKVLQAMGMVQAFSASAAQFQGLCPSTPDGDNLYIADVLQKAMVAVAEPGIEAAAATAVIVDGDSSVGPPPPPPVVVDLNRPFVIAVVDVPTGAVLFLGHIEDPTDVGSP
jgi:serpin B